MKREFFLSADFAAPLDSIYRRLGYRQGVTRITQSQNKEIQLYIRNALSIIKVRVAVLRSRITRKSETAVSLEEGLVFKSRGIAKLLSGSQEALIMGATCGKPIVHNIELSMKRGEFFKAVVFDAAASEMADKALDWTMGLYRQRFISSELVLTRRRFSAGYGDFTLDNQRVIFKALKMKRLGVSINKSDILVPEKSVTAVAGIIRRRKGRQ